MRLAEISPLLEVFSSAGVEMKRVNDRRVMAHFSVGELPYEILFFRSRPDTWAMTFKPVGAKGMDAYGDNGQAGVQSVRIYGIVITTTLDFLREYQPPKLFFMGETENGRNRVYSRFMAKVAPRLEALGYTYQETADGGFTIQRKG